MPETIALPYGKGHRELSVPWKNLLGVFLPHSVGEAGEPESLLRRALAGPIGSPPLRELARERKSAVILVSDITRPVPTWLLLPPLLEELEHGGLDRSRVRVVVATGLHRGHTREEQSALVGEAVADSVAVEDHSPDRCVSCGVTPGGLPVEVNRAVLAADLRICTGNIDPHYFVGYSGGAKAVMPGVSSRAAVTATHRLMLLPGAEVGRVEGNPVRAAIEEVGEAVGIDFILNVVVNERKGIVAAVAGHHRLAHREGCRIADRLFKVELPEPADIVVAAAGGYPKDLNLYQAQKGLDNARLAVKAGGTIILVAECREGFGDETFERCMTSAGSPEVIIDRMKKEFVMGGHKALAVALTMQRARVILVSSLPPEVARQALFEPAASAQAALDELLGRHPGTVAVLPYAGSVVPCLRSSTGR
ncbi:MAG: nickel-dependent lactate racemase [Bacillota bacterium]|nr:nickel-dependent lactate racemase [Bacillota bacterium]